MRMRTLADSDAMGASEATRVAPLGMTGSAADALGLSVSAASGETVGCGTPFNSSVRSAPVFGLNTLSQARTP